MLLVVVVVVVLVVAVVVVVVAGSHLELGVVAGREGAHRDVAGRRRRRGHVRGVAWEPFDHGLLRFLLIYHP